MASPAQKHITDHGIVNSITNGLGNSFIVWFSIYCSYHLLRHCPNIPAKRADWFMAFIVVMTFLIPSALTSWIALSLFSLYCGFIVFKQGSYGRNSCLIMLAISLRVPVSDICLKLFSGALLEFDAATTLYFLHIIGFQSIREGNIIIGPGGHELFIMTGCASFTNISLALLLWFSLVRSKILRWRAYLSLYIIPLVLFVMTINMARLSMMAISREQYFFYHDGIGADIVNGVILLSALVFAFLSIWHEKKKYRGVVNEV